jgi:hypothetical protein
MQPPLPELSRLDIVGKGAKSRLPALRFEKDSIQVVAKNLAHVAPELPNALQ